MARFPHLSRAPLIEAQMNFAGNASAHWDDGVRERCLAIWPDHTLVQDIRPLNIQFQADKPSKSPEVSLTHNGFLFRSPNDPTTAHQARRDGYSFSRLKPYEDWPRFEKAALLGWDQYCEMLHPDPLHSVGVRFINLLEFPTADFSLKKYFTRFPASPPKLDWVPQTFTHATVFEVNDSPCNVSIVMAPAFSQNPVKVRAFSLVIEVNPKPLTMNELPLRDILSVMHILKNEAFFAILTRTATDIYL